MKFIYKSVLLITASVITLFGCTKNGREDGDKYEEVKFNIVQTTDYGAKDYLNTIVSDYLGASNVEAVPQVKGDDELDIMKILIEISSDFIAANDKGLKIRTVVLNYESKDASGDAIILSERLAFPIGGTDSASPLDITLLDCHYSMSSSQEAPTKTLPIASIFSIKNAMVVSPDYQGLGVSEKRPQAYLGHTINAAQCIDGLKAAYSYMEQEKIKMKEGYSTLISGYSQGGGQALACQKHIETICIQKERDLFRLAGSWCGDGPYSPYETQNYFMSHEIEAPIYLPLVVQGMIEAQPKIMEGLKVEDYFSELVVKTPIIDGKTLLECINDKKYTVEKITSAINKELKVNKISDIASQAYLDKGSNVYKKLDEAVKAEDLCNSWKPLNPSNIKLFHLVGDQVVPYINAEKATTGLRLTHKIETTVHTNNHGMGSLYYYYRLYKEGINILN